MTRLCAELGAEGDFWAVVLGILLEMELAALPRDAGEACGEGRAEAGVIVADEEGDAVEAAILEGGEEVAPVNLGLAQSDADTEDRGGGRDQWRSAGGRAARFPVALMPAAMSTAQERTAPSTRTFS